jgi:hypothetical protein
MEDEGFIEDGEVDIGEELGAASDEISTQVLALYIPNKDKNNNEFGAQRLWLLEAARLPADIGGGFTIMPPVEGGWLNEVGDMVWENPVMIYTYIKPDRLIAKLPQLREFLHRMGRETNQGEVAFEFDRKFYRITKFDPKAEV